MSFARWMLTTSGLIRYMHPSDEELRTLAMIPKERNRKKGNRKEDRIYGKNGHSVDNGIFNVPRNLDIQLETTKVTDTEVIQLRYYTEYQWLVDFAFHAILVYTLTEVSNTVLLQFRTPPISRFIAVHDSILIAYSISDLPILLPNQRCPRSKFKYGLVHSCCWICLQTTGVTDRSLLRRSRGSG